MRADGDLIFGNHLGAIVVRGGGDLIVGYGTVPKVGGKMIAKDILAACRLECDGDVVAAEGCLDSLIAADQTEVNVGGEVVVGGELRA